MSLGHHPGHTWLPLPKMTGNVLPTAVVRYSPSLMLYSTAATIVVSHPAAAFFGFQYLQEQ